MRRKSFLIELFAVLICSAFLAPSAPGQQRPKLSKKKQELSRIRGNIQLYQRRLAESNRKESVSLATLDNLEKRNLKTRLTINRISNQISNNSRDISSVEKKISDASANLENLREEYASFARGFYEQGRMHDLELLLTSQSVNEMLVRYEYLKRFSDQTRLDLNSITSEKEKLTSLRVQLGKRLAEQQNYLRRKNVEETRLASSIVEHRRVIYQLRKSKRIYAEQLKRSQAAAAELESLIQNLIAEESRKKPARKSNYNNYSEGAPSVLAESLTGLKGHLPWPVSQGRVVANYGEQENPVLKTVTLNYGIDIAVPDNSQVRSVADGVVSRIFWLPSYGNLIIIDNYNGLRTVYSHLSNIFVREGEKVTALQPIGTVGESLGGSILHFEVWLNTKKQDPELWLSKR
jgi:septal ring factor EnvC (AmiA/AmiB activator)